MTRIDRYILSEISVPLVLGFFVYTFILLIQVIFKSADLLVRSDASASLVGQLFVLSLPAIVVLTLADGVALRHPDRHRPACRRTARSPRMRASGLSLFTLYRPVALPVAPDPRYQPLPDDRDPAARQQGLQRPALQHPRKSGPQRDQAQLSQRGLRRPPSLHLWR